MPATLTDKVPVAYHPEVVLEWRIEAFRQMKFPLASAKWLANTRVDLHQMQRLLDQGCDHSTAIRILEGSCYAGEDEAPYTPVVVEEPEPEIEE